MHWALHALRAYRRRAAAATARGSNYSSAII